MSDVMRAMERAGLPLVRVVARDGEPVGTLGWMEEHEGEIEFWPGTDACGPSYGPEVGDPFDYRVATRAEWLAACDGWDDPYVHEVAGKLT